MRLLPTTALLLLPLCALAQETAEERDVGWIQGLIEDNLSGAGRTVIIDGFEGALSSRATIASMTIADAEGIWFRAEGLVFDWTRSALFSGEIDVSEMSADLIEFARPPMTEDSAPTAEASPFSFALPDLPVGISIETIQADQIILGEPLLGQELVFDLGGSVSLSGGEGRAEIIANRLNGTPGRFEILGAYSNNTRILDLTLDLTEDADGIVSHILGLPGDPSVALQLGGTGPIDDYTADLRIATADIDRITGTFGFVSGENGQDIRLDIRGDVNALIETDYADFFGPDVHLAVIGGRDPAGALSLRDLSLTAQALSLTGNAEIGADGWPTDLALAARLSAADGSPVLLPTGGDIFVTDARIDLTFDASSGDIWTLDTTITDITQPGLDIPRLTLTGSGVIAPERGDAADRVDGTLAYSAAGMVLYDPALARALGPDISGVLSFAQVGDAPFEISSLTLTGPGVEAAARATITTADGISIQTGLLLEARDLARFDMLTGLALTGAADLVVDGSLRPLDGSFDFDIRGTTTDLALGIAALDPQITGPGQLAMQVARDTAGTRLDGLRLTTPEITATAQANLTSGQSTALFDIQVRDTSLSLPDLSGPGRLTGTAQLAADGSATADVALTLTDATAQLDILAAAPDVGGRLTWNVTTDIADLAPFAPLAGRDIGGAAQLSVTGTTARDFSQLDLDIAGTTRDILTGIAALDPLLAGNGQLQTRVLRPNLDALRLENLIFDTAHLRTRADASITLGNLVAEVDVQLTDLGDLVPALPGPARASGQIARTAQGIVTADLTITAPGQTAAQITARLDSSDPALPASGSLDLTIEQLSAFSTLAGLSLSGGITTQVEGRLDSLATFNTSPFAAGFTTNGQDLAMDGRRLTGPLNLIGTAARDTTGTVTLDTTATGPGAANLALAGQYSNDGRLTGALDARIGDLRPYSDLAGLSLTGGITARVSGTALQDASAFDLALSLLGQDLSAAGTALTGGIDLNGTAQRLASGQTDIDLNGTGPGNTDIALTASGQDRFDTDLSLSIGDLRAYAGLIGQPVSGALQADLSGQVTPADLSFDMAIAARSQNLDPGIDAPAQLLRGSGSLSAQVSRFPDGTLDVAYLQINYPNMRGTADVTLGQNGGQGAFDLALTDIGLFIPDLNGPATARGTAALLPGGGTRIDVTATGPGAITAEANGTVGADGRLNIDVSGRAPLGLANSFIEPRRLSGLAEFDLALNGPPGLEALSGTVRLSDGRLAAPSFQQALDAINGTIRIGAQTAQLDISGQLEGGGQISVTGPVGLSGQLQAGLVVVGQDLILRDPTLYETRVDARVDISGPLTGGAQISGTIDLGQTEIQVPSSSISTLGSLPAVQHFGASFGVQQTLNRAGLTLGGAEVARADSGRSGAFGLDLVINAPARVFIRGRGLDAELGGQLRITGTTAQVIPIGRFELVRGRIDILEQRFILDEGGAFLQGDFAPTIRLVASTTARDGTEVRIVIEGPATEPAVRFESSPDLPQDEVLSRLIFGRDLSEISPLQAIQLAAAISTLAGNSGSGLLSDFRQNLGLDDFDITTDADGNAAVRAGAYLSENIYTDVTVGTENTQINLNLDLTDDITITGSTGTDGDTSIGIFFERDY